MPPLRLSPAIRNAARHDLAPVFSLNVERSLYARVVPTGFTRLLVLNLTVVHADGVGLPQPSRPQCFPPARGPRLSVSESSAKNFALHDPDVRLMLEVREDSARAFEELMLRYQNRVITVLEHLVGHRQLAEDLAQDVFLRLYRSRKRYMPGAKFSTYLFTIANNVASNALRDQSRRREINITTSESPTGAYGLEHMALAASGLMPTRQADKAEMREVIRRAVGTLIDRQRMAVLLSKFEAMSYEEIAQTMEMTPKAVKSLLARARGNLRDVLEPYLQDGELRPIEEGARDTAGHSSGLISKLEP
jgi:RNA polymerase sigma-70 factor (ECF subfamily)